MRVDGAECFRAFRREGGRGHGAGEFAADLREVEAGGRAVAVASPEGRLRFDPDDDEWLAAGDTLVAAVRISA